MHRNQAGHAQHHAVGSGREKSPYTSPPLRPGPAVQVLQLLLLVKGTRVDQGTFGSVKNGTAMGPRQEVVWKCMVVVTS